MKSNLYIPKKINVGFEGRSDTMTGRLAFVNYKNEEGEIRRKKSFDDWRDLNIPIEEYDNTPQDGYIFNKNIERYGRFGRSNDYIRMHDSRGFEFEITIDNGFGILMYSDILKCEVSEKCVYAWSGQRLVLLPINSKEYQESLAFTEKQSKSIEKSDLIIGATYSQRSSDTLYTYLGKLEVYAENEACRAQRYSYGRNKRMRIEKVKQDYFYNHSYKLHDTPTIKSLAECVDPEIHQDFSVFFDGMPKNDNKRNITFDKYDFKDIDIKNELDFIQTDIASCIFYKETENNTISTIDFKYFHQIDKNLKKEDMKVVVFNKVNDYTGQINKKGIISTSKLKKDIFGDNKTIELKEFYKKIISMGYKNLIHN